ncbi:MAG: UDP-N-acetylmuramate--L-alanine ligase [Holosporaceae bacterium]|jgi:UDP-N-acetylmuramate--alanine ligase|nr:UDP-N-acetylmuramate--L-alanine ligase [Holosporaceae bacterium]
MRKFPAHADVMHFVGIGGIGMSGIADILINLGYKVRGSDLKENIMTTRLIRKGVPVTIGHKAESVYGSSVVIVSSAVSPDNPEVVEARRLGIPVIKRAEMLAELMKMKFSIAVAGTHGKTTTTSMVAAVLDQANLDPTIINGGLINAYNSNARLGSGDWVVVEADESDGSFVKLASTIVVVTNIDFDHMDNFKDFSELSDLFIRFIENIPFYGAAVLCVDHPVVEEISHKIMDRRVITYSLSSSTADVSCENVFLSKHGAEFDILFSKDTVRRYKLTSDRWLRFSVNMFGLHNVQNTLAAVVTGLELGISEDDMRVALGSFMGVKRRFTTVAEINGVRIVDDYAHHPVEICAVLRAARSVCDGKIFAVVQPHRYSRLKNFLSDFVKALELSDRVFIAPIYSAGEKNNGVDHFSLLGLLQQNRTVTASFISDISALGEQVIEEVRSGDLIIFLGAGDITQWAYGFADEFTKKIEMEIANERHWEFPAA